VLKNTKVGFDWKQAVKLFRGKRKRKENSRESKCVCEVQRNKNVVRSARYC
jgi:hypothetical protein